MAQSRLSTSRWVPPGAYLGRKSVPRPANPILNPRKVVFVGRGSRLKILRDVEITRSYVYNETLNFSGPPYKAYTAHVAKQDKTTAILTKLNGEAIPLAKWDIYVDTTQTPNKTYVLVDPSAFDASETYKFSYQSTDRTVKDPIPWYPASEMRQFMRVGSTPGADQYKEFTDCKVVITAQDIVKTDTTSAGDPGFAWHSESQFTGKDTRNITFTVNTVTGTGAAQTATVSWSSDTQEGGFGSIALKASTTTGEPTFAKFWLQVPNDVGGTLRKDGLVFQIATPDDLEVGQTFVAALVNTHTIDWSITQTQTDKFDTTQVLTDQIGAVTGTPGAKYIILSQVPTGSLVIKDKADANVAFTQINDVGGSPTVNVKLATYDKLTNGTLTATYAWRGNEPDPGMTYYLTASVLRPSSDYNKVISTYNPDDANDLLSPMTADNHAMIMAQIAWQLKPFSVSWVQVYDGDQDGVYTTTDFQNALNSVFNDKSVTDVVVLGNYQAIGYAKMSVAQANDPFYRGWRLQWNGMPINAAIGSDSTADSIIFTASRSLQFYGDSPGRGTQILVANRWAKRTITLDSGAQQQVTLDGSFIAGALAALNNSFAVPYETILRKDCSVFDDIDTFDDGELALMGPSSVTYLYKEGNVILVGESVTVDKSEPALNEISGRVQEQFVNRYVTAEVDAKLVSLVPDTPEDGAALTQSFIAEALGSLRSRQFVSAWTDDSGAIRQLNPNEDIQAVADEVDPRSYYYNFWYNLRYPGKRFMGLYSVGRNAFVTT